MALSPAQTAEATKVYHVAIQGGLPPARAKEIVLAAFHESSLDPNAEGPMVPGQGRAQGDMQLLSSGYVQKAKQLGGLHDTEANVGAILPDYQRYWQQHPQAPVGEAAAAVERSGKGAGYYGANADLLNFLGSKADGPAEAAWGSPGGKGGKAGQGQGGLPPIAPANSRDPRTAFALTIAQNIGKHNGLDPTIIGQALQQLHANLPAQEHQQAAPASPGPQNAAPGVVGQIAASFLGAPYKWGGTNPATGLDCSAFLQQVMGRFGVQIPRTTYDQVKHGRPVDLHEIQPGDAIFTEPGHAGPNHVGLYVGNGMVQESPHTGDVNKLIPLDAFLSGGFVAARRYLGPEA